MNRTVTSLVRRLSGATVAALGLVVLAPLSGGAAGPASPSISNIPISVAVGGTFTPAISFSGSVATSVTSLTPSSCSVAQSGVVTFLQFGACTLESHVAASQSMAANGFSYPGGVTVNSTGTLFVADTNNSQIKELTPNGSGGYSQTAIGSGFNYPKNVAVDSSGNVFVSDQYNNRIEELSPDGNGGYTQSTIGSGFSYPRNVAVDSSGNVYVVDTDNSRVVKLTPDGSGSYTQSTIASGFVNPQAAAVGANGVVYVSDFNGGSIKVLTPDGSGGYTQSQIGSGFGGPSGLAVDAAGTLYVAEGNSGNKVDVLTPDGSGGYTQTTVGTGFVYPGGVALDNSGNVYVADTYNGRIEKISAPIDGATQSITVHGIPSRPRLVKTKLVGSKLKVSWSRPFSDGGSTILGYRVTVSPGGVSCTTSGALTCTIAGLRRSTRYSISVVARNVVGTTTPSIVRNVVG